MSLPRVVAVAFWLLIACRSGGEPAQNPEPMEKPRGGVGSGGAGAAGRAGAPVVDASVATTPDSLPASTDAPIVADAAAADVPRQTTLPAFVPRWTKRVVAQQFGSMTALAADFTGDGKPDVVSGDYDSARIVLYVAPNWTPHPISDHAAIIHSAVFDVDADGDQDFVAARYHPGLVFWLERPANPTLGRWTDRTIDATEGGGVAGVHGILAADVDGMPGMELIAGSNLPTGALSESVVWFARPADPRAAVGWPRHVIADHDAVGQNHYVGFGDLDRDGRGDVAVGLKTGNAFAWWKQPANPRSRGWTRNAFPGTHAGATNVVVADVNGDGVPDVVASRGHGRGLLWFEGPSFTARPLDDTLVGPHSLAVGDIDRDGDVDVASVAFESKEAAWFENDGKGTFRKRSLDTNQSAYDARLVDIDVDGDLDLLVAGYQSGNVVYYEAHP